MLISRLKEAGLRAQHTAVKELLTDKHKLYHLAFAENNVDHKWDTPIFSDVSTFSAANDRQTSGKALQLSVNVSLHTQWSCVCCSMLGLEYSIVQKATWMSFSISTFCKT